MSSYSVIVKDTNARFQDLSKQGPYDIYVEGVFTENFEGVMTFRLGDVSSKVVGLIKLSQEFLITLLTTRGSDMFEPNKGTALAELPGSNFYDISEVEIVCRESVISAARQVQDAQRKFLPSIPEEVLRSAELLSINSIGDEVQPRILVVSEAGHFAKVGLPAINVYFG